MSDDVEVAVVGAGAMGAAAAWDLSRKGADVHVFEQFEPGHVRGASHGSSRNFNVAYPDEGYLAWLRESRELWAELEAEAATTLLTGTGIVNHGMRTDLSEAAAIISRGGFAAEVLDPAESARRWPGFRFETPVLFNADAGRVDAAAAVTSLLTRAEAHGAMVSWQTRVADIAVDDDAVRLTIEQAGSIRSVRARRLVITAGAWSAGLLRAAEVHSVPPLRVTQEQPAHFAVRAEAPADWPGFNHARDDGDAATSWMPTGVYGMYTPGEGVKAGFHAAGPVVDPDTRSFVPDPGLTAALVRYAREWLPGVDPDAFVETTCTYTSTPDSSFFLERVGPVVVGAGFSGHGFKFTPAMGRILGDLARRS